jgi:hypothetical protein
MALNEPQQRVLVILRTAYPHGIDDADYEPLLAVLAEEMCHENIGKVAAEFYGRPEGLVVNDLYGVLSDRPADATRKAAVFRTIAEHGWTTGDDWDQW